MLAMGAALEHFINDRYAHFVGLPGVLLNVVRADQRISFGVQIAPWRIEVPMVVVEQSLSSLGYGIVGIPFETTIEHPDAAEHNAAYYKPRGLQYGVRR
jgi:hypothetical protein